MLEADAASSPQHEVRKNRRLHPVRSPAPAAVKDAAVAAPAIREQPAQLAASAPGASEKDANDSLGLLQKALEQLSTRKQSIESELARIEGLRAEHEALVSQVAALEQALKAFQHNPRRQSKTA